MPYQFGYVAECPPCPPDADGDGYGVCDGDCDDDPSTGFYINPGATEICDGVDNDCNGEIDNDLTAPYNSNQNGVCNGSVQTCDGGNGWQDDYSGISGYEDPEISCDGADNDCDGQDDNGLAPPLNSKQADICSGSTQQCTGAGGWQDDYSGVPNYEDPETLCDTLDNDCNGQTDEYYMDADSDGYNSLDSCINPADCNDNDDAIHPGAKDICGDNIDQDCDGDDECAFQGSPECLSAGNPVDLVSGANIYSENDIEYPSPSMLRIVRNYNSGNTEVGAFGLGTSTLYDKYLFRTSTDTLTYVDARRNRYMFTSAAPGTSPYLNTTHPSLRNVEADENPDGTRTMTFADGTVYDFDASGMMVKVTDPKGNYVDILRDTSGNLVGISDSFGRSFSITPTTTANGHQVIGSVADALSRTVEYHYTPGADTLDHVIFPNRSQVRYTYENGILNGTYFTDDVSNPTPVEVLVTQYAYDQSTGRMDYETFADGGIMDFNFVESGGVVTQTEVITPNGPTTPGLKTTHLFGPEGYRTAAIVNDVTGDPVGWKTESVRETGTNLLSAKRRYVDAQNYFETSYGYDQFGLVNSVTDPAGNQTIYMYDQYPDVLKPTQIIQNDGTGSVVTTMSYYPDGSLKDLWRPGVTNSIHYIYTALGLIDSVTDELDHTTWYTYYDDTSPNYGMLESVENHLNETTSYAYDDTGRLTGVTDPKGKTTKYEYFNDGRDIRVTTPMGRETFYLYNGRGQLLSVIDPEIYARRFFYNDKGNLSTMTDQLMNPASYSFDLLDRPSSVLDRKNQQTDFSYPDKKTTQVNYFRSDQTLEATVATTLDDLGRISQVSDTSVGAVNYTYTDTTLGEYPDRVKSVTDTQGTISYTYDDLGRRTSMTVAGQPTVHYSYTQAGLLNSVSLDNPSLTFTFTYDDAGRRTLLSYPNGLSADYAYDEADRLKTVQHTGTSVSDVSSFSFDVGGNVSSVSRTTDDVLEIGAPVMPSETTMQYDGANRITTWNGNTVVYDLNGNLERVGVRVYTWDARGRLVAVNEPGVVTASFTYDALGRRIEKTINGVTSTYLYDGWDIVQETTGGVTYFYVRTLNIDEPLARLGSDGSVAYYHLAPLGSVVLLTDGTGQILTRYKYSPFGVTVALAPVGGTVVDQPFQFTGREWDGATGEYYFRARYYNPTMKRFISEDPIGYKAGDVNFYRYVENSPLVYNDPTGLILYDCTRGAFGGDRFTHRYLYSTALGRACGMGGKSGSGRTTNPAIDTNNNQSCIPIYISREVELAAMRHCEETVNDGLYIPGVNDCHEGISSVLEDFGLPNSRPWGNRINENYTPIHENPILPDLW